MDKNNIWNKIKDHYITIAFILVMTIVYLYNMFANGPWYDELYTYYYFISRGPIYAAIHWPVPNNHVGYSVLSAFFDYLGNPYIGLRIVSVLAAVANISLIYHLCNKFINKFYSFSAMALYAGSYLPFRLSFQGRGYTLAVTCLLLATSAAYRIAIGDCRRKFYFLFGFSLCLGLYIVPSSIYWVIPICITGGLYLLLQKRYKDLLKLILSGVYAAVATFFLYLLIWLAIGANLLSKDSTSQFFGISQVKIILKAPFAAAGTGIEYMLASPYIQSIDRFECIKKLPEYFVSLLGNFYTSAGLPLLVITIAVLILNIVIVIRQHKKGGSMFLSLFVSCGLLVVPLMLIIQSVHPYLRVLSFYAIFIFIGVANAMFHLIDITGKRAAQNGLGVLMFVMTLAMSLSNCLGSYYNGPLAERENDIHLLFMNASLVPKELNSIFYTDDFQKYVLKFYYDANISESYVMEDAQYIITGPEFFDETYTSPEWPVLYGYSDCFVDFIENDTELVAEAGEFRLYKNKNYPNFE